MVVQWLGCWTRNRPVAGSIHAVPLCKDSRESCSHKCASVTLQAIGTGQRMVILCEWEAGLAKSPQHVHTRHTELLKLLKCGKVYTVNLN